MDKDPIFRARVHRYLYSKDSSDESEEMHELEVNSGTVGEKAGTVTDPRDKLFERHKEFIKNQLAIVKKIQLKGILSVSSKQSVEDPVTTSQSAAFDECLVEKDGKAPQTSKNRKRKLKKKRRREQQLITKKLKEETGGGDIVDNTSGDIANSATDDSAPNICIGNVFGDANGKPLSRPDDSGMPSYTGHNIDSTSSDRHAE